MADPFRRSPLSHRAAIGATDASVRMRDVPFLGKFVLRGADDEIGAAAAATLDGAWASDPLSSAVGAKGTVLWLGPDERLVIVEAEAASATAESLRQALAGTHHQLVDASDYYTVIELAGVEAWKVLSKTTTLDLHPRAFAPGVAAGGTFGHAQGTLWRPSDEGESPLFRMTIRWSMADYLWCLLAECGREFGLPAQAPVSGERLTIG